MRRLKPRLKQPRKNKTDLKLKLPHPKTLKKNTDLKKRPRKLRRLKSKRSKSLLMLKKPRKNLMLN